MAERMRRKTARYAGFALAVAALLAILGAVILRLQALPRSPQPVAWGRETCARCNMHISDPRFAAQLQTKDGRILNFDDPGCLVLYEAEQKPDVHAMYFRAFNEDRWLSLDQVAFVDGQTTPMAYGFGAVPRATPGAISYADVRQRLIEHSKREARP